MPTLCGTQSISFTALRKTRQRSAESRLDETWRCCCWRVSVKLGEEVSVQEVNPQSNIAEERTSPHPPHYPTANRLGFNEEHFFLLLSIFIGVLSGVLVVCFRVA